ncbi:MAG: GIY-YIG nuclease family protein [Anaerolineaceae bacterium]|nr:GIY-YIG nuclease family protein [Anaerolineaceae bacterium]
MANNEFFPQRPASHPMIYAYSESNPHYKGLLKVGYTEKDVERRVGQQYPTKRPDGLLPYQIVLSESAMRNDGTCFTDHDLHRVLLKKGFGRVGGEWFSCTAEDVKAAIVAIKTGTANLENRIHTFALRPEQKEAVDKTMQYFASTKRDDPNRAPKFLWNAKMRFGKTFAAYQLAKRMGFKKVLVLTFKPAVEAAWDEDLMTHVDFEGWQFICRDGMTYEQADLSRPLVCFGSFQDYLGTNDKGGIKAKNEWVHTTNWDIVIFDEYHFGAWRENARNLFEQPNEDEDYDFDLEKYKKDEADNAYNETFLPITSSYYLFLSGTPFRAINSGEFIEDQIYNWTYSDEQRAKENWGDSADNPYAALPRMVMLTYKIPDSVSQIALQGEFNEFDLNLFFSAKGKGKEAKFVYENEVQKWLDLIRGSYMPASVDDMKLGQDKRPPMPFSDTRLLNVLTHTFWFLPNVASCQAMAHLLMQKQNTFFHGYTINVCAGSAAGIGVDALAPVQKSMGDPLATKTITLSCGKLTTGVTVRPWTGIFMLRNLKSPETYFQAAFRVQSPWEITTGAGTSEIMKHECYLFDFALDRALKQISDYSCRLNVNESNPEKKVAEFINFLPVLAYDGSSMKQISAQDVLDIAMAGTSATLLAKRWESALLVNVDNETLARLMANKEAMEALMRIEGFRSLNADIETIINKSEAVKKARKEGADDLTPKEKKELSEEEKEYKSIRKQIQEKLIKFATRIPIFMYLTDYRERSLKDVITQLEPGLFKKVTGLDVKDFELLVSLNVFNGSLMNDAIFKFKRYEDASLSYTGIDKHEGEDVGGWDTVIKRSEYEALFYIQQSTMAATEMRIDDLPEVAFEPVADDGDEEVVEEPVKAKTGKSIASPKGKYKTAVVPVKPDFITASFGIKSPIAPKPEPKEEKSQVDTSGVAVGITVLHKNFGPGKVIELGTSFITVVFREGKKRFSFPESFENGFLKI